MSWETQTTDCCTNPDHERQRVEDDGEYFYQFTECQTCGAEHRDQYRYVQTDVDSATLCSHSLTALENPEDGTVEIHGPREFDLLDTTCTLCGEDIIGFTATSFVPQEVDGERGSCSHAVDHFDLTDEVVFMKGGPSRTGECSVCGTAVEVYYASMRLGE